MRKLFTLSLILGLALGSCKKEETKPQTNNSGGNNNYYFTAKVDGMDWSADVASTTTYANKPHQGMLTISASLSDVTAGFFLINLSGYSGAKSYSVGGAGNNSYARYTTGSVGKGTYSAWKAEDPGSSTTGTVVITSDDGAVVEGTVVFDGYSEEAKTTKKITEGKFRLKLQ